MITFLDITSSETNVKGKGKAKYLVKNGRECFAEELVIGFYQKKGLEAIWSENEYWKTLAGSLFWDVIYAKVKRAVKHSVGGGNFVALDVDDKRFNGWFDLFVLKTNGIPGDFYSIQFLYCSNNFLLL